MMDVVVTSSQSHSISVVLGKGDGTFESYKSYPTGQNPGVVALEDLNLDGVVDAVVVDDSGLSLLTGNGDGSFGTPKRIPESNALAICWLTISTATACRTSR